MGNNSFRNNVPDPLLSGKELPAFKFELEKSKGKVLGNSFGKEVTVEQLPISTRTITGVSMQLEPGVMRELHWHRNAEEWAIRYQRRCERDHVWVARPFPDRTPADGTTLHPQATTVIQSRTSAASRARILIGLNSGIYESIDLSAWIAEIQSTFWRQFQQTESLIRAFPRKDVFISPNQ